ICYVQKKTKETKAQGLRTTRLRPTTARQAGPRTTGPLTAGLGSARALACEVRRPRRTPQFNSAADRADGTDILLGSPTLAELVTQFRENVLQRCGGQGSAVPSSFRPAICETANKSAFWLIASPKHDYPHFRFVQMK